MAATAESAAPWKLEAVHTAIPGRARFRLRGLRGRKELVSRSAALIRPLPGVTRVSVSAATGTLLVVFSRDESLESLQQRLTVMLSSAVGKRIGRAPPATTRELERDSGQEWPDLARLLADLLSFEGRASGPSSPPQPAENWHAMSVEEALEALQAHRKRGLDVEEVRLRREQFGANELPKLEAPSAMEMWLRQFTTLPVGMLAVSGAIALATGGVVDAAAIASVVLVNAVIGYRTERDSEQTIAALASGTPKSVFVRRGNHVREIPMADLVLGDLIPLMPGSYVPADARIVENHRLMTDESALTGESMPVTKRAKPVHPEITPLADRNNMVYGGTTVTGGSGQAVVVATGRHSEWGRIQEAAGQIESPETPMQRQLGDMGAQLAMLSAVGCAGVFGVGILRGYGMLEMLKSSISLGVAAVPEGLPTVATTTLALGIREMGRHNVAVRQLDAVEALGSVGVFCLDKTGTLTQNRMDVVAVYADGRRLTVDASEWSANDETLDPLESATHKRLVEALALCNESVLEEEGGEMRLTGTPTENALLKLSADAGIDVAGLRRRFPLLKTRYRSEERQYMVTHHRVGKRRLVAVKGSPGEMLPICRWTLVNGRRCRLSDAMRKQLALENERWANEALRVLAVATARIDEGESWREHGLTWLGLVGMTDPLREGMPEVIEGMHQAGIRTVMITGDQSATAYAVAKELNLSGDEPLRILDSTQMDQLPENARDALAQETHVFARVSPGDKLEIVQTLQRSGQVVAMTGDGINDGPALKAADVGVAMGGAGQDVARSLSDVVLEDDQLSTMQNAVAQGRTIYTNIRKALQFLLSTNFSEIEVMLAAFALGLAPPLNPMQLLWVNLITDVFPGLALALEAPEPDVMQRPPRDPKEPIIRGSDLKSMALESGVITAGTLASYGWGLARYGVGTRASGLAFNTLTTAQLLHALLCRSENAGLYKAGREPNRYLDAALAASLAAQAGTVLLPPVRKLLGVGPIGLIDLPVIAVGTLGPLLVNDWLKRRRVGKKIELTEPPEQEN